MDDFYVAEGRDHNGVPTKLATVNCSLNLLVYSPASMYGIHVTLGHVRLLYSEIAIGVGQVYLSPFPAFFPVTTYSNCPYLIMVLPFLPWM
jgi:hypothetical protein